MGYIKIHSSLGLAFQLPPEFLQMVISIIQNGSRMAASPKNVQNFLKAIESIIFRAFAMIMKPNAHISKLNSQVEFKGKRREQEGICQI